MSSGVTLRCSDFGVMVGEKGLSFSVQKFTWETESGLKLSVLNLDAAIVELCVPNRTAQASENILLGVDSLDEYLQLDPSLLCAAHFEHCWPRLTNNHPQGNANEMVARRRVWFPFVDGTRLQLTLEWSSSLSNGLIIATLTFSVEPSNVVHIEYRTSCAAGGLIRLSHRFLLNLGGRDAGARGTYEHVVQLNADSYVDDKCSLRSAVENLADLRIAQHLGLILYNARNEENYDEEGLCGIFSMNNASEEGFAMRLIHSNSGRALELYCNFPWIHVSSLNHLPEEKDAITPFYPGQRLRRLSLVFDIERFVVSIVDAVEKGPPKDAVTEDGTKDSGGHDDPDSQKLNDKQQIGVDHKPQERFTKHAGLLIHPIACPFKIKRGKQATEASGTQSKENRSRRSLTFVAHTTLKFGICKPILSQNVAKSALRQKSLANNEQTYQQGQD